MGRFKQGILGDVSGLVGNAVFTTWRGLDVVKERPTPTTKPATLPVLAARASFKLMTGFMNEDCAPLFAVGFQSVVKGMTPFNKALSLNRKEAVTGVYPALSIDYSKVVFAQGRLLSVMAPVLATTVDAQIDVSWENNAPAAVVPPDPLDPNDDKVTVVAYCPVKMGWAIKQGAAERSAEGYDLQVPVSWAGSMVHVWCYFVRSDGKKVSDSEYLGVVEVQ
ncbi:DUF6266 family protein [Pedobacter sp. JY14-1]|uniref:DUF6266 family protein n=1 Tax=Pedobacter sp. JY14-1 TaxID=3034151 RepID=UPI0023E273AB|nr:DUF6266 family protein [Pedobacter sp. JY14-1]